eukprot:11202501-Lingulodinium_polyedra.AAC.1
MVHLSFVDFRGRVARADGATVLVLERIAAVALAVGRGEVPVVQRGPPRPRQPPMPLQCLLYASGHVR